MLLVLVAVDVEYDAIIKLVRKRSGSPLSNGRRLGSIWISEFTYDSEFGELPFFLVKLDAMGPLDAAIASTLICSRMSIHRVAMPGIAAGLDADLTFGDIMIAESSQLYDAGKIMTNNRGEEDFRPTTKHRYASKRIMSIVDRFRSDSSILSEIQSGWKGKHFYHPLQTKRGPFFCGDKLIASAEATKSIQNRERKVLGIDMESYGVLAASTYHDDVDFYVVKSISDKADEQKDDSHQAYAAYTSAKFVLEFESQIQVLNDIM